MKKIAMAAVMACSMGGAFAQAYVGAGVGMTHANLDCTGSESCESGSSGGKIYVGYAFNPAVSAELGYLDFGTAKMSGYLYGYLLHLDYKSTGMTAAVALRGTLTPVLSGVARLGFAKVETKVTGHYAYSSFSATDSETKTKPYVGLGLEYAFSKNLKGELSADFTRGEIYNETTSLRLIGVGLRYAF